MSIDLSKVTALSDQYGAWKQVADASGRVIWAVQNSKPAVLQVAKITSNTYAGETTYTAEEFILLDIYPKTNGTVTVTYGGLTKTITDTSGAAEPNAQQVSFGTFNGVSDSVATPASGELTIEGDYYAFGCGVFVSGLDSKSNETTGYCNCVTAIPDFGSAEIIPEYAFMNCFYSTSQNPVMGDLIIPEGIRKIDGMAFYTTSNSYILGAFSSVTLPSTLLEMGQSAFTGMGKMQESYKFVQTRICTILASNPPILTEILEGMEPTPFGDLSGLTKIEAIYVPKGCGEAYKAAYGWRIYESIIMEVE